MLVLFYHFTVMYPRQISVHADLVRIGLHTPYNCLVGLSRCFSSLKARGRFLKVKKASWDLNPLPSP